MEARTAGSWRRDLFHTSQAHRCSPAVGSVSGGAGEGGLGPCLSSGDGKHGIEPFPDTTNSASKGLPFDKCGINGQSLRAKPVRNPSRVEAVSTYDRVWKSGDAKVRPGCQRCRGLPRATSA